MQRVLLLGGTTEASLMAKTLAGAGRDAVFSYAGRTDALLAQPLPTRIGGFGGVDRMADYIRCNGITHVIDATHPFAAQISRNAADACAKAGVALIGLVRPAWQPAPDDRWQSVADIDAAVAALPDQAARVFLAIGKQNLGAFAIKPQHHYLLRLVDPPTAPLPLRDAQAVIARGPFDLAGDLALLRDHRITHIVAKNSGGAGAVAKLIAARQLSLPVIMIDRPAPAQPLIVSTPDQVMDWLDHAGTARGV